MDNFYIYLHIKETTGEPFYVGKGKGRRATSLTGRNKHWKNIVNKYGFDIIFLEKNLTEEEAFEREKYWIKRIGRKDLGFGPLCNFTDGGEGISGKIFSKEERILKSLANKGRKFTKEHKEKISKSRIGIKPWNNGRKFNKEEKEKHYIQIMKIAEKRAQKVLQIDFNDNIIKEWNSVREAANSLNIHISSIRKVINGKYKQAEGYKWKYLETKKNNE